MTRPEFIELIKSELTVGCALPYSVPDKEFNRIIDAALRWSYIDYQYAVSAHFFLVQRDYFTSKQYKSSRQIKMPDCVVSVYEVKEIKGFQKISYFGADFSAEKMIAQEIYLSPFNADDMVLRTAYESYWDLSKAFFIDRISYDYNHNTKIISVVGRDPRVDVCISAYVKIPEESLFEDWTFQRYCVAQSMISMGRILGMFTYNLPGGISINADSIKSDGEAELEKILERVDAENVPDWCFIFH